MFDDCRGIRWLISRDQSNLLFKDIKMNSNNHKTDQSNDNKGTLGTNKSYQKVLDNRSQQLNPNNPRHQGKK